MLAEWPINITAQSAAFWSLLFLVLGFLIAWGLLRPKIKRAQTNSQISREKAGQYQSLLGCTNLAFFVWGATDLAEGEFGAPDFFGEQAALNDIGKINNGVHAAPHEILRSLIAQNTNLAAAILALRQNGTPFIIQLRNHDFIGSTDGAKAVLQISKAQEGEFGAGLPFPSWRTDSDGKIIWGNKAFLDAVEMPSLEDALKENAHLDAKARADCKQVIGNGAIIDTRAITICGARHFMRVFLAPSNDGSIGAAFDITEEMAAQDVLGREVRAHTQTLNHLNDAVAVFDANHNLTTYNHAFSRLWAVEESWLDERPSHEEILDRLRERSRLPHQGNFLLFKAAEIAHYKATSAIADETWTLPDGRILRVMRQRQPMGGILVLYEDISDKATLQAQFKTQIDVQRTTLDRLKDGVAVFSGDGKLALANIAFAQIWGFEPSYLEAKLDFSKIHHRTVKSYSKTEFWQDIEARICDPTPAARQETQGQITLNNGKVLAWLTRPLPDGATLLAFADVTAQNRMEGILREKADALLEADRLKTAFLEKVSYQLRTPLNTIKGYSELLGSGIGGELTTTQKEYTKSINQGSEQLEKMIDDLLDLAMIDAGQAPLDLGDVDIFDVLETTKEMATTKMVDSLVKIEIKCEENIGLIRADDQRVRQIMANLVNNAMRTTDAGGTITLEARKSEDTLRLAVTSSSNSESEDQALEFEAFTEGSRRGGMGLVLVKKFVELHGGLVVMSDKKAGEVTITCHLPIEAKPNEAVPELDF